MEDYQVDEMSIEMDGIKYTIKMSDRGIWYDSKDGCKVHISFPKDWAPTRVMQKVYNLHMSQYEI